MNISSIFYFSKSTSIYTIQWPIGHSWDDVVHKIPHKLEKTRETESFDKLGFLKFSMIGSYLSETAE